MQRRLLQYDAVTGEQIEGTLALHQPKRTNGYRMWIAVNQESVDIFIDPRLKDADKRVLWCLICAADLENKLLVSQTDLGKRLGMASSHVNRSFSNLIKHGILEKEDKVGRFPLYKLNFEHFWKGDARMHKEMMHAKITRAAKEAREKRKENA